MIRRLIEFLTPADCAVCGRQGQFVCLECVKSMSKAGERCEFCNMRSVGGLTCDDCLRDSPVRAVTVATDYDGPAKSLLLDLKFRRGRAAASGLGALVASRLADSGVSLDFDWIVPVPISPARRRERGYNQSELIAKELARELAIPCRSILGRVGADHQIGLERSERLSNIKGRFYATRKLGGERVLLVDDVITTGATLAECARVLVSAGSGDIRAAVVAKHLSNS